MHVAILFGITSFKSTDWPFAKVLISKWLIWPVSCIEAYCFFKVPPVGCPHIGGAEKVTTDVRLCGTSTPGAEQSSGVANLGMRNTHS